MDSSSNSNDNQLNSGLTSRIKKIGFYILVVILYLAVLSPSILPTYFYFTPEKPEKRNDSLGRNVTTSGLVGDINVSNTSVCNEPLIPQKLHLQNITVTACVPPCGWTPLTQDENYQINATIYTACFIAIISLIIILMTWFKVSELWKFPHFIIVIMLTQSTTIISVVSVASFLGNSAFCSSKFFKEALKKATPFCLFEGALLHYFEGSISLWFVVYNAVVAKGLVSKNLRASVSSKWQFIIGAAVCWILPIIPVIIVLTSTDGYSAVVSKNYCFPGSSKLLYYTALLPENVLYAIGVSFLFVIVWKLLKEKQVSVTASNDQAKIRKDKMNSVVKRLTLLMVFYSATVCLTYGSMAYVLREADALQSSLNTYFYCLNSQLNCTKDYRKYVSNIPLIFNYIAAGIFPLATVLFMAANERTRRFWKTPFHQLRSYISQHSSSSKESRKLVNETNTSERQLADKSQ